MRGADSEQGDPDAVRADVLAGWQPKSDKGAQIKAALQSHQGAWAEVIASKNAGKWSCAPITTLDERAAQAHIKREQGVAIASCDVLEEKLRALATSPVPIFVSKVPAINDELVAPAQRGLVLSTFRAEIEASDKNPPDDPEFEQTIKGLLMAVGCPDGKRSERACTLYQQQVPKLTDNRRVVRVGEAYSAGLTAAGLDPEALTPRFTVMLQKFAYDDLLTDLMPRINEIAKIAKCLL